MVGTVILVQEATRSSVSIAHPRQSAGLSGTSIRRLRFGRQELRRESGKRISIYYFYLRETRVLTEPTPPTLAHTVLPVCAGILQPPDVTLGAQFSPLGVPLSPNLVALPVSVRPVVSTFTIVSGELQEQRAKRKATHLQLHIGSILPRVARSRSFIP